MNYVEKRDTINSEDYIDLLNQLNEKIREKKHVSKWKRIIHHQNH